jgi:hypothetical protein
MGKTHTLNGLFVAGALALASTLPLSASTIFDNSSNDLSTRFSPGALEVGDEILLDGTDRYLTSFSFEFWGVNAINPFSFAGHVQARVRFYEMSTTTQYNGYYIPGTKFYDSGLFDVPTTPTGRDTFNFSVSDFPNGEPLFIPSSDITWSIQFEGMGATDTVGLDIYSPPTVGQDFPDYWSNNGGWQLLTNSIPMDFAAQFNAQANIPEPSVVTLSVVGGLGILAFARRLRRKE